MRKSYRRELLSLLLSLVVLPVIAEPPRGVLGLQMDYTVDAGGQGRIVVSSVSPGSASERGGLVPGDAIVQISGKPLRYPSSLELYRANLFVPGVGTAVLVERAGKLVPLVLVPDLAEGHVREVETFVAELERCKGDVSCASKCAEAPTFVRQESPNLKASPFFRSLELEPNLVRRLTIRGGVSGRGTVLSGEAGELDYHSDTFLTDVVAELSPLLAKVDRVEIELQRSRTGISMKFLHPEVSEIPGLLK